MSFNQSVQTTVGALRAALQKVLKAVDTRQVTLQFKKNQMFLHACLGSAHAHALVQTTGTMEDTVLPLTGKTVLAIVNGCEAETVCTLSKIERGLRMTFGGAKVTLDRFRDPDVEMFDKAVTGLAEIEVGEFNASQFRDALQSVVRFVSHDDQRLFLRGVFLQVVDGKLVLAATDAFRLAERKSNLMCHAMPSAILPANYAEALCSVLKDEETVKLVSLGEGNTHNLAFKTPAFSLKCPVYAGLYPDYQKVIPILPSSVVADTVAMIAAIDRMAILSGRFIRLSFDKQEIAVMTADRESTEQVTTTGDAPILSVSMQAKLLADALGVVKTPTVSISVNPADGAQSKLLLKNVGEADDGWQAVVMPATV